MRKQSSLHEEKEENN